METRPLPVTLIRGGEVYDPAPVGRSSILMIGEKIAAVGPVEPGDLERLGWTVEVIDATGFVVAPGFIDPHIHLTGGSGEPGFGNRGPDIQLTELTLAGTTTVVGLLGTDSDTRSPLDLLAKVRGLKDEGLSAFMYTGGYDLPPVTLTGSVRRDLMIADEILGLGEVAISDHRSVQPDLRELAKFVIDTHTAGMLTRKAGVTHFHTGERSTRLSLLRGLLDEHEVEPGCLYPTHINRSKALMDEAIELARRGCFVDLDSVEEDYAEWLPYYLTHGGPPDRLTVSSDADNNRPGALSDQLLGCVRDRLVPLETALPLITRNPATVLKLGHKGRLAPGADGDVVLIRPGDWTIHTVVARGRVMVKDGTPTVREAFIESTHRSLSFLPPPEPAPTS